MTTILKECGSVLEGLMEVIPVRLTEVAMVLGRKKRYFTPDSGGHRLHMRYLLGWLQDRVKCGIW
jgi:hypothetical protein